MTATATKRRLRVGVCRVFSDDHASIVAERTFAPGADVTLGGDTTCGLVVPEWVGPPILLISGDGLLHLAAGMRVNMCGEGGESRIVGTYEVLKSDGVPMPIPSLLRAMNITIAKGLSVFARYLGDQEA
jgi:hypothetical protein